MLLEVSNPLLRAHAMTPPIGPSAESERDGPGRTGCPLNICARTTKNCRLRRH